MAYFEIPIEGAARDGAFLFSVSLDGSDYQLVFQYNSREDSWYFDLNDVEGTPIRSGIKVVANFPLTRLCQCLNKPPGAIMALNTEEEPTDPGLEDLGSATVFSYVEEESLP